MDRPSLHDIYQRVKFDLDGMDLRYSFNRVLSHVISGTAHMLNGYSQYLSERSRPDSEDEKILLAWCSLYGVERKAASKAKILLTVESTDEIFIQAGTKWSHESGIVFSLKESVSLSDIGDITLECETAGEAGNIEVGDSMTVTATVADLKSVGKVSKLIVEGFDTEPLDRLRSRLRERLRHPSQGGSPRDYINWALEYPAATRAWVLPRCDEQGVPKNGHVCVAFLKDSSEPTDAERRDLQNQIKEKCPILAIPHVVPTKTKKLVLILELEHDSSLSKERLKLKISHEISFMLSRLSAPKGFLNKDLKKESGTIYLSDISRAISMVSEVRSHRIVSPTDHISPDETGQVITLGEVIF